MNKQKKILIIIVCIAATLAIISLLAAYTINPEVTNLLKISLPLSLLVLAYRMYKTEKTVVK